MFGVENFKIKFFAIAICTGDTVKKIGSSLFFINKLLYGRLSQNILDQVLLNLLQAISFFLIIYAMYISRYQAVKELLLQWQESEDKEETEASIETEPECAVGRIFVKTITLINFVLVMTHAFFGYQQLKKKFTGNESIDENLSLEDYILGLYSSITSAAVFLSFTYPRIINNSKKLFHKLQHLEHFNECFDLKMLCQAFLASIGVLSRTPKEYYASSNALKKTLLLDKLKGQANFIGSFVGTTASISCKLLFESGELLELIRNPSQTVSAIRTNFLMNNQGYIKLAAIIAYSIIIDGLESFVATENDINANSPIYHLRFIAAILIASSTAATEFAVTSGRFFHNRIITSSLSENTPFLALQNTQASNHYENYGSITEVGTQLDLNDESSHDFKPQMV